MMLFPVVVYSPDGFHDVFVCTCSSGARTTIRVDLPPRRPFLIQALDWILK